MTAHEIDLALRNDRTIEPSLGFAARVMRAVHLQVDDLGALAFPWRRLLPGLIACVLLTVVWLAVAPPPTPEPSETMTKLLEDPGLAQAVTWVVMVLLGSWALVWGTMRFAGHRG